MPETYQEYTDAGLAQLVRQGQGDAFAELSARYLGLIRGKARRFEGAGAPEKEDLWQEGLLGLYAAAITYKPDAGTSFSSYAGVCVFNRMASAVRRHGNNGNRVLNESVPLEELRSSAAGEEPQVFLELRENFQSFWKELERSLSPLERRALGLYLNGVPRQEAAQRLSLSPRTYDNALPRARKKIQAL